MLCENQANEFLCIADRSSKVTPLLSSFLLSSPLLLPHFSSFKEENSDSAGRVGLAGVVYVLYKHKTFSVKPHNDAFQIDIKFNCIYSCTSSKRLQAAVTCCYVITHNKCVSAEQVLNNNEYYSLYNAFQKPS